MQTYQQRTKILVVWVAAGVWNITQLTITQLTKYSDPQPIFNNQASVWVTQLYMVTIAEAMKSGSLSTNPRHSMYSLFTYIYHKIQPNVGK